MFLLLLAVLLFAALAKDVDSASIPKATAELKQGWFIRALKYMKSNPETLEVLLSDEYAVLEGDMLLLRDRNAVESIWPMRDIPYDISSDLESRTDDVLAAMAMVSEHTCMSFHRRTSEINYLLFKKSKGCASYVGFIGGQQPVFVGPLCTMGNIVHEILHALGFHHEHTRTDRDQYITILTPNIMEGLEENFHIQEGKTFHLSYDIGSIMHYGGGYFSANGLPTIVPHGEEKNMGQRINMTKTDIERVRRLYNCEASVREPWKKSNSERKKEDANVHQLFRDVASGLTTASKGRVFAERREEGHTSTPAPLSASLHHLNAATRGRSNPSGGKS